MPPEVRWTLDGDETSWPGWAQARAGAEASPLVQKLVAAHPAAPYAWALDVGCGTGSAFAPLVEAGYRVIGLDPTMAAVEQSRQRVRLERLPASVVQASAAQVPVVDDSLAFVFAVATLFHLGPSELLQAVAEVRRVLQPGGDAVLHFLDAGDWRRSLAPEIRPEEAPVPGYRAILTCFASGEAIKGWLGSARLEIVSLEMHTRTSDAGEQRNWIVHCTKYS